MKRFLVLLLLQVCCVQYTPHYYGGLIKLLECFLGVFWCWYKRIIFLISFFSLHEIFPAFYLFVLIMQDVRLIMYLELRFLMLVLLLLLLLLPLLVHNLVVACVVYQKKFIVCFFFFIISLFFFMTCLFITFTITIFFKK